MTLYDARTGRHIGGGNRHQRRAEACKLKQIRKAIKRRVSEIETRLAETSP